MPLPTTPPPARDLSHEPPAPGGPAPSAVPTTRPSVHTLSSDLRGAMTLVARELAREGWAVELQGSVSHGPATPLVPALLAISAFCALIATARPWIAAAVVLLAMGAVLVDLNGGRSPLRWLLPRHASRSLLIWPAGAPAPPGAHQPGPHGAPLPADTADTQKNVLVVLPARIGEGGPHPVGARLALVGAAAVATSGLLPSDVQDPFAIGAFAVLLLAAIASMAAGRRRRRGAARRPGTAGLVRQLAGALRDRPPLQSRVCVAAVGGLEPWLDPLETLLRNGAPTFPPERTMVVVWHPGAGPLQARLADGVRGAQPASPQLVSMVTSLGLPAAAPSLLQVSSGGQRARACGWRAISLVGGGADPEQSLQTIQAVVRRLDKGAVDGEW